MIRTKNEFYKRVQSCIAPIYFYDPRNPDQDEIITRNGTLTIYRNGFKIFGITNHHVLQGYKNAKQENPDMVCKIGFDLTIDFESKLLFPLDEKKISCKQKKPDEIDRAKRDDLVVIFLTESDLEKMGNKYGFTNISYDILRHINCNEEINGDQRILEPTKWNLHIAGFPASYKEKQRKILPTEREDNYGIWLCKMPARYNAPPELYDYEHKVTLYFNETRDATKRGEVDIDIGELPNEIVNLQAISGCPLFAQVKPYEDNLTLLGIVYEGPDGQSLSESIFARPISLITDILQ